MTSLIRKEFLTIFVQKFDMEHEQLSENIFT